MSIVIIKAMKLGPSLLMGTSKVLPVAPMDALCELMGVSPASHSVQTRCGRAARRPPPLWARVLALERRALHARETPVGSGRAGRSLLLYPSIHQVQPRSERKCNDE